MSDWESVEYVVDRDVFSSVREDVRLSAHRKACKEVQGQVWWPVQRQSFNSIKFPFREQMVDQIHE